MFSFLCGIAIGAGVTWLVCGKGKSIVITTADRLGNVAGGDIIGGDKEVTNIINDLRHKSGR